MSFIRFIRRAAGNVWNIGWLLTFAGCVLAGVSMENYNVWLLYLGLFLVVGGLWIRFYWYFLRRIERLFKR